ncbi:hypothetical protein [Epibacterium ulvae]|uniref:hypothetical protein n=1 Tax=Epibacterium ulvae TaxID=1156985 RepID=UPI002490ADA6|nr:hypothetical protein [Epibacterium ulvae]
MTRVVGHTRGLSSPLLSLSGAGQTCGASRGVVSYAGSGFVRRLVVPRHVPGSPNTGDISGICTVLNADGSGKLITCEDDTGGIIVVYDIQNWDDFADPANTVLSSAPLSRGGYVQASHDGRHLALFGSQDIKIYQLSAPWDLTTAALVYDLDVQFGCVAPDGSFALEVETVGFDPYVTTLSKWNASSPWDFSGFDHASPDETLHVPELWNNGGNGLFMPTQDLVSLGNRTASGLNYGSATCRFSSPGDLATVEFLGVQPLPYSDGQIAFAPGRLLNTADHRDYLYELI